MSWLDQVKKNLQGLFGTPEPEFDPEEFKGDTLSPAIWQKRREVYGSAGAFTWYGVDEAGEIAEFDGETTFVPEVFFQDYRAGQRLIEFFDELPETTTGLMAPGLRPELAPAPHEVRLWTSGSETGLYTFFEPDDEWWNAPENEERKKYRKNPYELFTVPAAPLKFESLPEEIRLLLGPFRFQGVKFAECQFLDVSQHFYCKS